MISLRSTAGWAGIDAPILLLVLGLTVKLLIDEKDAQRDIAQAIGCGGLEFPAWTDCTGMHKRWADDSALNETALFLSWAPNQLQTINRVVAFSSCVIALLSLRFLLQLVPIIHQMSNKASVKATQRQQGERRAAIFFNVVGYASLLTIIVTLILASLRAAAMARAGQLGVAIQSIQLSFLLLSLLIGTGVACGLITGKKGLDELRARAEDQTEIGDSERGSLEKL